jgi:hypothetical protein
MIPDLLVATLFGLIKIPPSIQFVPQVYVRKVTAYAIQTGLIASPLAEIRK